VSRFDREYYQGLSLDDLYDVRDHINRTTHRDRFRMVIDEIERREAELRARNAAEPVSRSPGFIARYVSLKVIGGFQVASGITGLLSVGRLIGIPAPMGDRLLVAAAGVVFALNIVGGGLLLSTRWWRRGIALSIVLQWLQLLQFRVGPVAYKMFGSLSFALVGRATLDDPWRFYGGAVFNFGADWHVLHSLAGSELILGINLVAALCLYVLEGAWDPEEDSPGQVGPANDGS